MKKKNVKYLGPNNTKLTVTAAIDHAEELAEIQYKNFLSKAISLAKEASEANEDEVWTKLREVENTVKLARKYRRSIGSVNLKNVQVINRMKLSRVPKLRKA